MCSKGLFKRMLPFAATLAVGVFIASFFVTISGPTFRGGFGGRQKEIKRLRYENELLRNENSRLKTQTETQTWAPVEVPHSEHESFNVRGPELPVEGPPPPPHAPRARR